MSYRRIYTGILILVGALLAIQIFNSWYESGFVRLIYDIVIFLAALFVLGKVKPSETVRRELLRLTIGILFQFVAIGLYIGLMDLQIEALANSYNEGWLLLLRIPLAFSLAWSTLVIIRIGESEWARRRRRIIASGVIALALALTNAPEGIVFVFAVFVVFYVIPGKWIDELKGKWGWLVLAMLVIVPLGAGAFLVDIETSAPTDIASLAPRMDNLLLILESPFFNVLRSLFGAFWLFMPFRFIAAVFQGTFGIRVPIWVKLSSNYIFSSIIPGLLLLALIFLSVYTGIGTMRARAVRNLINLDLQALQDAHKDNRLDTYADSDSLLTGRYYRVFRESGEDTAPEPPASPTLDENPGGGRTIQGGDVQWRWDSTDEIGQGFDSQDEYWIKMTDGHGSWTLPDTLPLFPGWKDSTYMHYGIVPIGKGRVAYASAIAENIGSHYVDIAFMPLNRKILERYKKVVKTEITISAYNKIAQGFSLSDGSSPEEMDLGRIWEETKPVTTHPYRKQYDSKWDTFIHTPLYHGVCELQVWPGESEDETQMLGMISVSTSFSSLVSSLYTQEGLNRVILIVLAVLAGMLGLAVLFSSILGFGINRTITSSISALRAGTEQLRKGNLDTTIQVKNRDELGDLAFSFNQMTADLRRMIVEVAEKERLEQEVQIARKIQLHLLPTQLPEHPPLMIGACSEPALEVGGDYYDAIDLGERGVLMAIGDVSGKGVGAAMLMSNLQANLHILSGQDISLEEVVTQLNSHIFRNSTAEMFITFFIALFDPKTMRMKYINAGHDTPALVRNSEILDLEKGGLLLGVMPDSKYESEEIVLEPGDILACYSDGLTEAMDEEGVEFGRDRLIEAIVDLYQNRLENDSNLIVSEVLQHVRSYAGNERAAKDDLTLLIAKVDSYNPEL